MSTGNFPGSYRIHLIEPLERRCLLSVATGSIEGYVVRDTNHNFQDDWVYSDDPGMGGVTVFIDTNDNGKFDNAEPSRTSDTDGFFWFDMPPGRYRLREIVPAGFGQISPEVVTVVLTQDDLNFIKSVDFLNTDYAIINGTLGANQITVEPDPGGLLITVNGKARVQSLPGIAGLYVRAKAGDDLVSIDAGILLPTRIEGGNDNDTMIGGGGKNWIFGGRGNDSIDGGAANDRINGQAGDDIIHGGAGNDGISGEDGNDVIFGEAGNDDLKGGAGNNFIDGGDGNDTLGSSTGDDSINGGADNDFIDDRAGMNLINGGGGNDLFNIQDLRITVDGGLGIDRLTYYGKRLPKNVIRVENSIRYVPPPSPPTVNFWHACFLTTAVVGWEGKPDNCPELTLLRKFRDTYMNGLPDGPDMIRDYYAHAPRVVRAIENNGLGGLEWPRVSAMIQTAIRHIQAGQNAQALAVYAAEYLRLKARYV